MIRTKFVCCVRQDITQMAKSLTYGYLVTCPPYTNGLIYVLFNMSGYFR